MRSINNSRFSFTTLAIITGIITGFTGLFIFAGWQLNPDVLKNSLHNVSLINLNDSLIFILSGIALILLHRHSLFVNLLVRLIGMIIFIVGILSLAESQFGMYPAIDKFLLIIPDKIFAFGKESVYNAINSVLIGISFVLLTMKLKNRFFLKLCLILPFSISVMVFFGHWTGLHDLAMLGTSSAVEMPLLACVIFIILSVGMILTSYELQKIPITIEHKLLAGITTAILVIVLISFISAPNVRSIKNAGAIVAHTIEVEGDIREILGLAIDVETGARGYLISGKEIFLEPLKRSKEILVTRLRSLQTLTADNQIQQSNFNELSTIIAKRVEVADALCALFELNAKDEQAFRRNAEIGRQLSDSIQAITARMLAEENRLSQNSGASDIASRTCNSRHSGHNTQRQCYAASN